MWLGPGWSFKMEASKCNKDYQDLLQTLALLEAQKIQAIKDIELLEELKLKVDKDPMEVLSLLQNGSLSDQLPRKQVVATVPDIDWSRYRDKTDTLGYNTRKKIIPDKEEKINKKQDGNIKETIAAGSYGQPWTEEEQTRLEELLKIYPPEDVEAKRWQKIASALGNRTTKQVCCRVQKYFIKLAKAGLPVPGRMPNLSTYSRKNRSKRSSLRQPSLFFHSLKPRVYMTGQLSSDDEDSDQYSIPSSPLDSAHSDELSTVICSSCCQRLHSTHWICTECTEQQVLLCGECVNSNWCSSLHSLSHDIQEVSTTGSHEAQVFIDKDYTQFKQSSNITDYNYLDPNFFPAL